VTFNLDAPVLKDANGQHYRHNEHLVAVTELPLDTKGVRAAWRHRNDRWLSRRPLVRREPRAGLKGFALVGPRAARSRKFFRRTRE
jgi:hypothetical protein